MDARRSQSQHGCGFAASVGIGSNVRAATNREMCMAKRQPRRLRALACRPPEWWAFVRSSPQPNRNATNRARSPRRGASRGLNWLRSSVGFSREYSWVHSSWAVLPPACRIRGETMTFTIYDAAVPVFAKSLTDMAGWLGSRSWLGTGGRPAGDAHSGRPHSDQRDDAAGGAPRFRADQGAARCARDGRT